MPSGLSRIRRNKSPLLTWGIYYAALLIVIGVLSWIVHIRVDLTADKRYSLHPTTVQVLRHIRGPLSVTVYLVDPPNAGFRKLQRAVLDLVDDCNEYADIDIRCIEPDSTLHLTPTVVYDHTRNGSNIATPVYPYLSVQYGSKWQVCNLLHNDRSVSGAENLNHSIEDLEFVLLNAIHSLTSNDVHKIAFLEGHGEASEKEVYDFTTQLANYFTIDRGTITSDASVLDNYATIIIVSPKTVFTDQEKYIIDQYIMRGGTVLWLLDGVQFQYDGLTKEGFTPILPSNSNIADMLFRYGVRIEPALIQDLQCLNVPVNMSLSSSDDPNFQLMPWTYAPLLLCAPTQSITKHVPEVLGTFVSPISGVGDPNDNSVRKELLLCSSSHSTITRAPGEVNLMDFSQVKEYFTAQYLPVAVLLEGTFTSFYAHRLPPDGLTNMPPFFKQSVPTKQVVIAGSSIATNVWQENVPLPMGYDRTTKCTFGNRTFLTNVVLYLSGNEALLSLRQRDIVLRLLNRPVCQKYYWIIQLITLITPILLLLLIASVVLLLRHKKYVHI